MTIMSGNCTWGIHFQTIFNLRNIMTHFHSERHFKMPIYDEDEESKPRAIEPFLSPGGTALPN